MSKPELGTKRICPTTGRKFYDLNKDPIVSPYTGQIVPVTVAPRTRADIAAAKPVRRDIAEAEQPEAPEAELVPLEEADAEVAGPKGTDPDEADEEDVELAQGLDDAGFLEESEDEDEDVADIIGGDIEDEEET